MRSLAARNGGRAGLLALAAILLVGLGLRVDYAWEGRSPVYDAQAYARIAATLHADGSFSQGERFQPPAYQPADNYSPGLPLAVAGLYEIRGGVDQRFARVALALLGSLAVLFAYLIGRRLAGVGAGLIGAACVAVYPALLEYQGMLMGEPLAATLLAGAVLAMLRAADVPRDQPPPRRPGLRWLLPGLLLGALALVRPEYLAIAGLLGVVVLLRAAWAAGPTWRASLAQAAVLIAGVLLVVAPWTIRNAVALDRFVPISTGGGQVLFAGAYLPSDGDPERVGGEVVARHPGIFAPQDARRLRLEIILARLAAHRHPGVPSDEALARMGRELLWRDISERPLDYLGFLAAKVGRIWSHGPRDVMRKAAWEALHWALVIAAAIGLALLALRRRWEALLFAAIFVAITAVAALLVASPRRVLVLVPLLAPLAGLAITGAAAELRTRLPSRQDRPEPRPTP